MSFSPSISLSLSPSKSPSVSLSPSFSPSISPSVSISPSPSPAIPYTFTADGIVLDYGFSAHYWLNGRIIPRPKTFQRDYLFLKEDIKAIDGKTTRDYYGRKERYILTWETMEKIDIDYLIALVDLKATAIFSVNDRNLIINETNVWLNLSSLEYSIVGSDYLASLTLELIEEVM